MEDQDSDQVVKWKNLMDQYTPTGKRLATDLLKAMELQDDIMEDQHKMEEAEPQLLIDNLGEQNEEFGRNNTNLIDSRKLMLQKLDKESEEIEDGEENLGEQTELPRELVLKLEWEREEQPMMRPPGNKKQAKESPWGPVLVERQRRNQNKEGSMLQKAMELKQKRNLEPIRGNSSATLQHDCLNQVAKDANINIGKNAKENTELINNLMKVDRDQ